MSFHVLFEGGSLIWKCWNHDLFNTIPYEIYCRSLPQLHPLLTSVSISAIEIKRIKNTAISLVVPGDVVYVDLRSYGYECINLYCCIKVTDAGVSALGAGCSQLQDINIIGCKKVTDAGVSALAAGCGRLHSIDISFCGKVTDAGISELAAERGKLRSIDLAKCGKVTDAGMSALAAGCGRVKRVNIECCKKVTDAGIVGLYSAYRTYVPYSLSPFRILNPDTVTVVMSSPASHRYRCFLV